MQEIHHLLCLALSFFGYSYPLSKRTSVYAGAGGSCLELKLSASFPDGKHKSENRMFQVMTGLVQKFGFVLIPNSVCANVRTARQIAPHHREKRILWVVVIRSESMEVQIFDGALPEWTRRNCNLQPRAYCC